MDHAEAIVQIDGMIDENFCDDIINIINNKSIKQMTTMAGVNKKIRNVIGYSLDNIDEDRPIYDKINKKIEELYVYYKIKFLKGLKNKKINQIDLLKYEVNGKHEIHVDTMTDNTRNISVIINLNDDYEGGDLLFVNPMKYLEEVKRTKLKKGTIVFFPSSFMYPHSIRPITKGTRYSIVAWLQ